MSMTFEASSSVTLLFDFWSVHGVGGMLLSVLVVFLLTLVFELLKVFRIRLSQRFERSPAAPPAGEHNAGVLEGCSSESSLTPIASTQPPAELSFRHRALVQGAQAALHSLQVLLGYTLMLCVMSYNTWIFLAVICGSMLGYFLLAPLLSSTHKHSATM
ncbi:unnamed protein product [Knipowitschia caucasica]|uniref:Copper transport protein n=1 Tax=Knipowitschia caucasica TaxID=637954 RepID=A0AAV2IYT3_KNICA